MRTQPTATVLAAGFAWTLFLGASAAYGQLPAGATRLEVSGVECRNLSGGSTVRSTGSMTEWDCAALGLAVQPGDLVAISVRGRVPLEATAHSPQAAPGGSSVAPLLVESEISDRGDNEAEAADLDLDGDQDLILEDEFRWLEFVTDEPPTFVEHDLPGHELNAQGLVALDLDSDGRPDIVSSFGGNSNLINWHRNVPGDPPVFLERPVYKEVGWQPWRLRGGDFDGDGDQDILSRNHELQSNLKRLVWHENNGGGLSFTSRVIYEIDGSPFSYDPADLDGDGDLDIFVSRPTIETLWLENDGASEPSWQLHLIDDSFGVSGVGLADFDHDGDLDAIAGYDFTFLSAQAGAFEELRLYENVDGLFDQIQTHTVGIFEDVSVPIIGDLNGDGWPDLFQPTDSFQFEGFHWLENRGGLVFQEHLVRYVDEQVPHVRPLAIDLGADGDLDLVGHDDAVGIDSTVRVEAQMTVGGWSLGLTPDGVRCRNLTTGQRVSSSAPLGAAFDCEALGLSVSPGDVVQTLVRGVTE